MKSKTPDLKAAAKRAALRALTKVQRRAARDGIELSEWEDGFLTSVSERIQTYGRGFADPDKGGPGQVFSAMQARKLKEIAAKAKGESQPFRRPSPRRKQADPET